MRLFAEYLVTVEPQHLFFFEEEHALEQWEEVRLQGFHIADVDADRLASREDLFRWLAQAMKFPSYFGWNWDAAHECLADLEWLPAKGYVLVMRNAESFWRRLPREAATLLEVCLSAAGYWRRDNVPFRIVFIW